MAEKKPSAVARPDQGVRRTATHSGVTHVRAYQPDNYTIVGNHLLQHRELSLTAIGLATHILSLPEGSPVDIRTLAEHFAEGRDRIAFALRELEAHGYLERVRERTETGRLFTRTYAHHVPGRASGTAGPPASGRVAAPRVRDLGPAARPPADGRETPQEDGRPEAPAAPPDPPEGDARRGRHHERAVTLLAGLRRTDERLTLSHRDVHRLAPAVTAWFDGGATAAAVHRALTTGLPPDIQNPARLLAYRLQERLPPPLPPRSAPASSAAPDDAAARRPLPFQTCDGCERAFRAAHPGRCRDCRSGPPTAAEPLRAA
ncbi:helix-turn-helix domain-containing protein [Streptomyces sp. NPDC051041]|uniref:helix-turn-helix domain-containing protein n=1 Tax=Streptomyces sp. NPDC051041 TaxID=3365640 RepID=UPI00378FB561